MRDDLYVEDSERAINEIAARPPVLKKQEPSFSAWGMIRGLGKSVPAGVAEVIGSTADVLKGYGQVSAATQPSTMFGNVTEKQSQDQAAAFQKMQTEGIDMDSNIGRSFRNAGQEYMPDPATAHQSEVIVAEFGRVMTKAIGSTMLTGTPIPAALEEGMTASDKLQQQGVDKKTATKVGLVTAAANSVAFGLPVAGSTLTATVGLAAVSGPTTYIAQESATREILRNAKYDDLAEQHDPMNPVGLGLATLGSMIPGGIVLGLRARSAAQAARAASEAVPAELPPKTAVAQAVDQVTVDAARVQVLRETIDRGRLSPADDLPGGVAHRRAMETANEQLARGEPVSVARDLPEYTLARLNESRPFVDFVAKVEEVVASARPAEAPGIWFSSSTVRDLQVLDPAKARDGNLYGPAVYMAKDQSVSATYARGGIDQKTGARLPDGQVYAAEFSPTKPFDADKTMPAREAMALAKAMGADKLPGLEGKPRIAGSTLYKELTKALGGKAAVNKALAEQGYDAIMFKQQGSQLMAALREVSVKQPDGPSAAPKGDVNAATAKAPRPEAPATAGAADAAATAPDIPAAGRGADSQATGVAQADGGPAGAGQGLPVESPGLHEMAAQLEATHADMMVQIEGREAMTVAELMRTIREEVAQDLSEVPLVQAAATCFLTNGGGAI